MTRRQQANHLVVWGGGTARTMRAHWVLDELGLEYEKHLIGSRTGETETSEFQKLNPRGKIPVLQDGDLTLAESAAIVTYLIDTYGQDTDLIPPPHTRQRALYYQWCFFIMTELDAHTLYILRKHRDLVHLYGEAPNANKAAEEGFAKQVKVVEKELLRGGPYILGETFTGADILLTTVTTWADWYNQPLSEPLKAYTRRVISRKSYQRAGELNYAPGTLTQGTIQP